METDVKVSNRCLSRSIRVYRLSRLHKVVNIINNLMTCVRTYHVLLYIRSVNTHPGQLSLAILGEWALTMVAAIQALFTGTDGTAGLVNTGVVCQINWGLPVIRLKVPEREWRHPYCFFVCYSLFFLQCFDAVVVVYVVVRRCLPDNLPFLTMLVFRRKLKTDLFR